MEFEKTIRHHEHDQIKLLFEKDRHGGFTVEILVGPNVGRVTLSLDELRSINAMGNLFEEAQRVMGE